MKKLIKKTVLASAAFAAMTFSAGAMALTVDQIFSDFTVTQNGTYTQIDGRQLSQLPAFTADKIGGLYNEVITFSPTTPNSFSVSLLWNAGQFATANGSTFVATPNGGPSGLLVDYYLYATYTGNGTVSAPVNGVSNFDFAPGGAIALYLDPNKNTVLTLPGTGGAPIIRGGTISDDILLASGIPTTPGGGTLDPSCKGGQNCGSFQASENILLTADGSKYFTAPNPFYNISFQSGQFNTFSLTGTQTTNGTLDVTFHNEVPEPGIVALIGLGLVGLGLSRRRSKQA